MVNDQESQVVINTREELVQITATMLLQAGVPLQLVQVFCSLRFFPLQPWGITEAIVNGEKRWCITQGHEEDMQKSRVVATFIHRDTQVEAFEDARGIMPILMQQPDKSEIN